MDRYDIPSVESRSTLSEKEIAEQVSRLEIGNKIVFNDKKEPLRVESLNETIKDVTGVKVLTGNVGKDGTKVYYVLSYNGNYYRRDTGAYRRRINWIKNLSKNND